MTDRYSWSKRTGRKRFVRNGGAALRATREGVCPTDPLCAIDNGLVLTELGCCLGKPKRPVYPHVSCVQRQRPLFLGMMGLAFLVSLAGFVDFFILH